MTRRKVLIFSKDLNEENVEALINTLDEYDLVNLYFEGLGGEYFYVEVLSRYINLRGDDIHIYLSEYVCSSSACLALLFLDNTIYIGKYFEYAMFHLVDRLDYSLRKESVDLQKYCKLEKMNADVVFELNKYLPKRVVDKFVSGEDIYIGYDDVKKYFGKRKNINFI